MKNPKYIEINKNAYNEFAKQHAERHKKLSKYDLTDEEWINLLKENLINMDRKNKVLEIGPATGRILKIFEEKLNCYTTAVELSSEMIKYAKEKSPNTIFIEDNILNVDFDNEEFDAIFMGAVIHNFPKEDVIKLLNKIKKWIKKDGKILIVTTIHNESEEGYYEKEDYNGKIVRFRKKFTENELKETIENVGFKIIFKMYNNELDRKKFWLTYIISK